MQNVVEPFQLTDADCRFHFCGAKAVSSAYKPKATSNYFSEGSTIEILVVVDTEINRISTMVGKTAKNLGVLCITCYG